MADKYANISALTEFLSNIKTWAIATFSPRMSILSYGNSTWDDFIDAYNDHSVVYCRASSNSNPASGSQTRLAFMAYVNNAETPTEVEFQYYRSVNSHSASQQGDQVYVYKLTKTGGWTVMTREAMSKIATEKGLDSTYASGTIKLKTKLKSESQSTLTAADKGSTADREYAVGLDASGNLSVNVPWTGTITGINMNGASKGTSGVVDLGTVITAHQDISGKADKADLATVATSGSYNDLSNKPTIPAAVAVKGDSETTYRTGNVNLTKANIGLGNVGNFKAVSTAASQGLTDTEKSNARTNIGAGTGNGTVTSVTVKGTSPISVDSESAITGSGTRTISHANSGATAGSYGDSAAQTPAYGGTFKVPYVTVNATGHVTGISEHTVKIPASDNTNTHRPIQVNGTQNLGDNTTALNLKNGSNVSITADGGNVTIAAADTTYSAEKGISLSNGKFGHSNTAITAQTTQAVYPIKIDAYGHITAYGSAVTSMTPSSHTHGNIQNGGTLQTNDITIASGDKLVVTDLSNSSKVARSSISFDGSTTNKFLSKKGTWEDFGDLAMYDAETVISNIETPVIQTEINEETVFNISGVEFTIEKVT